jgi:hypothetical protein
MDYTVRIKHPYRGHHYVLQNVLILQAVQVTLYTMENSGSFMEDPAQQQTEMTEIMMATVPHLTA